MLISSSGEASLKVGNGVLFVLVIRFFYTGQVPKGVEVLQAAADPSKILKKTGEMNKIILHDNLTLFLELSDFYDVAELKDIV